MLNPNPYMQLSSALDFSAADLNANRLGVITAHQWAILSSQRLYALGWSTIMMVFLGAAGYAFHMEFIFIVFCGGCLVSMMVATWRRFQADAEGRVEVIVGKWTLRPLPLGRYAAIVNGQSFAIPKHIKSAFSENGRYRVYYTPGTHTILSAEII